MPRPITAASGLLLRVYGHQPGQFLGLAPVAVLFSVTNATGPVDFVANYGNTLHARRAVALRLVPPVHQHQFLMAGENILDLLQLHALVAITNGDWYLAVVNVAGLECQL